MERLPAEGGRRRVGPIVPQRRSSVELDALADRPEEGEIEGEEVMQDHRFEEESISGSGDASSDEMYRPGRQGGVAGSDEDGSSFLTESVDSARESEDAWSPFEEVSLDMEQLAPDEPAGKGVSPESSPSAYYVGRGIIRGISTWEGESLAMEESVSEDGLVQWNVERALPTSATLPNLSPEVSGAIGFAEESLNESQLFLTKNEKMDVRAATIQSPGDGDLFEEESLDQSQISWTPVNDKKLSAELDSPVPYEALVEDSLSPAQLVSTMSPRATVAPTGRLVEWPRSPSGDEIFQEESLDECQILPSPPVRPTHGTDNFSSPERSIVFIEESLDKDQLAPPSAAKLSGSYTMPLGSPSSRSMIFTEESLDEEQLLHRTPKHKGSSERSVEALPSPGGSILFAEESLQEDQLIPLTPVESRTVESYEITSPHSLHVISPLYAAERVAGEDFLFAEESLDEDQLTAVTPEAAHARARGLALAFDHALASSIPERSGHVFLDESHESARMLGRALTGLRHTSTMVQSHRSDDGASGSVEYLADVSDDTIYSSSFEDEDLDFESERGEHVHILDDACPEISMPSHVDGDSGAVLDFARDRARAQELELRNARDEIIRQLESNGGAAEEAVREMTARLRRGLQNFAQQKMLEREDLPEHDALQNLWARNGDNLSAAGNALATL